MQTDFLPQLKSLPWKQAGGLIIPTHLTRYTLSPVDVAGVVYLTHEEVMGRKYTQEELEKDLSQLSVEDCMALISKILTVLENEGRVKEDVQKGLTQELFEGDMKEKILSFLHREPKRIVFFGTQLLLLAKYAMLFAKKDPANDFMEMRLFSTCMKIILGITDLVAEATEGSTEPELQKSAMRSMYFFSRPNFFHALIRIEDLFINIPNKLTAHHQYLDIPALFQEATGLTLENYLILGVSLTAHLMAQKQGQFKNENWYIVPEHYFSGTMVSQQEIDLIMREFTSNTEELEALYTNQDNFEYNFNGLVQRPLVTFDKSRFFPLDLAFLKDKITSQVYWILFDYIKKTYGQQLHRYTNFMGICFEEYVYKLLTRIYPDSPILGNRLIREFTYISGKAKVETVDNILINPSSLIFLETKVSQLQVYLTGIVGDLEAFRSDVRKIIVKAFKTIQRTKEDFQKGLLKKELPIEPAAIEVFYPVVITYSTFIMFPLVWKIVEEEIKKIPNYDPILLDNLQIIQADEIEIVEAIIEISGKSFEELLRMKNADLVYKRLSFHNYFQFELKEFRPLVSTYQEQKLDNFGEALSLKIFGKKLPYKTRHVAQ